MESYRSVLWAVQFPECTSVPSKQTLPRVDAFNVTVQHQLTNTIALEVAYVGSKGTHGFAGDGPNYDVNPASMANFGAINPSNRRDHGSLFTQNERRPLCGPEITTPGPTRELHQDWI